MPEWAELFADVLDLQSYEITRYDKTVIELSIHETVILGVLAQARGRWKAKQTLAGAIYGGTEWTKAWDSCVRQHIQHLRDKIPGCTFHIDSDNKSRGLGYRLIGHLRVIT